MKLPINIKKKQSSMPVYSAISLIMLCIALFCLFTPFIPPFSTEISKNMQTGYMILGGVGTMFFAFVTSYTVFNIISPPVGVTVSEEGIYEYTVAGFGAGFIPKEAIISLKTFGKDKRQYLGIKVDADYVSDLGESVAAKKEIAHNVDAGIPAVIIRQCDIYITVNKLLKIIMEAYGERNKTEDAFVKETKITENAPEPLNVITETDIPLPSIQEKDSMPIITDDVTIATAITDNNSTKKAPEKETISVSELPPPPNVIKTVDELLEKLNISTKPSGSNTNKDTGK